MKNIVTLIICTFCSFGILADDNPKYKRGDCITPTDKKFSWFGEVAKVEAFSEIDGFSGKSYILLFPKYLSNSVIFTKAIEKNTKKVAKEMCSTYT